MPQASANSDASASPRLPWQAQAVWVVPTPDGGGGVEVFPPQRPAKTRFLLTNDALHLGELLESSTGAATWAVIDLDDLHRLLHPESAAERLEERFGAETAELPPVRRLWTLWEQCERDLRALPCWALDMVAQAMRELEDHAMAALFGCFAGMAGERRDALHEWAESFPPTVRRAERPDLPDLTDCTAVAPDEAVALLAEGGALARCVPGYEPRPGQLMMVRAVVDAINSGVHLVVEAGTGVGKSLGYLLPAALWARLNDVPVVVSTNTRNLQTQLIEKDLPAVQRMLDAMPRHGVAAAEPPRKLRTALIKGRSNYLCLRRLSQLIEQTQFDLMRQELRAFAAIICWAARTPDGDLDTLLGGTGVDQAMVFRLCSQGDECAGHACGFYRRCFVQKARERALRADLVVANHALVFTEMGATTPVALPRHAQVIFDEAHNLEEAATRFFSIEASPSRLATFTRRLAQRQGKRRRGLLERLRRRLASGAIRMISSFLVSFEEAILDAGQAVDRLRQEGHALFRALYLLLPANGEAKRFAFEAPDPSEPLAPPPAPPAVWKTIREAQTAFREAGGELAALFQKMLKLIEESQDGELNLMVEETSDLTNALQTLTQMLDEIDFVLAGCSDEHVFWVERAYGAEPLAEAWAAPLKVGPQLAKHLYETRRSVILCSATLSVGGRFDYIGERLGLNLVEAGRIRTCIAPSPFDYVRQCRLLVPAYLPEPNNPDRSYVTELATLLCQLGTALNGRTLVLFTSYEMLRQCARLAGPVLEAAGIRLLVQGESGSRDLILRTFRKGEGHVLLGTHSFWEGVDVVGDALSCVIVARLPFSSPGEPVLSARCEQREREGTSGFRALSLPSAVLRLRQGFGRLIRHRGDRGLVIIADTRILSKSYGGIFRRSLPSPLQGCPDSSAFLAQITEAATHLLPTDSQ